MRIDSLPAAIRHPQGVIWQYFSVFVLCFSTNRQHNHCDDDVSFYSSRDDFIRLLWQFGHQTDALPPIRAPRRTVPQTGQGSPLRP